MSDRVIKRIDNLPGLASGTSEPFRKKRVAAYARVSTDSADQQSSFAAQVDYYTKVIAEHAEWEFVRVYADDGVSGLRQEGREGFMQMITDCESGLIGY